MWAMETCNGFYRPITLGRLGLPDRLPFSDCQVKAILQVDADGSGKPMSEQYSDAINKERTKRTCMTCRMNRQNSTDTRTEQFDTMQCNEATEMCNFAIVQLEKGDGEIL